MCSVCPNLEVVGGDDQNMCLMVCGLATGTEDLRILFLNYFPRLYYAAYTDLQELLQKLRL